MWYTSLWPMGWWISWLSGLGDALSVVWFVLILRGVQFGLDALEEDVNYYGRHEIMNRDQGSPFSSHAFTWLIKTQGI